MKKAKRIKSVGSEIPLPEAMIQHIQSFLSCKEAARTTILSKSWYNAWLTRPTLDFDTLDFRFHRMYEEFVKKTMQRYRNSSLKVDSLRLCTSGDDYSWRHDLIASSHNLIVDAMKMGATTVQLEDCSFTLPLEVLGSETLLKLSLIRCRVYENCVIRCSRLKSLTLEYGSISDDVFKDLTSCCISMEELSVSCCSSMPLKRMIPFQLHKLKRLFLRNVDVRSIFSSSFSSSFPCLRDLSILDCYSCTYIQIASTSLETICLETDRVPKEAKFDVPNIRKFTYSCSGIPSHFSINGPSREWKFDMSIVCNRFHKMSWFTKLKKVLKKLRLSRISLLINLHRHLSESEVEHEVDVEVVPKPLVLENLVIHAPSTIHFGLLARSLGAFRPKFVTQCWVSYTPSTRLIEQLFVPSWQEKFGQFGLKKARVEIRQEFDTEWRPLVLKKRVAAAKAEERRLRLRMEEDPEAKVQLRLQLVRED